MFDGANQRTQFLSKHQSKVNTLSEALLNIKKNERFRWELGSLKIMHYRITSAIKEIIIEIVFNNFFRLQNLKKSIL